MHLAYPQEFDDAGADFVNKRFQAQQALAKAQGPPAATLVLPGIKLQLANSTAELVAIRIGKAVGKPWAFAMKTFLDTYKASKRRERVSGLSENAQFEISKKMLDAMGSA